MKKLLLTIWRQEDGALSFEWTVLTSLLTVGVVSGIAAVRDAVIDEMGDVAQAMVALDQSYLIEPPLGVQVHTLNWGGWGYSGGWGYGGYFGSGASGSQFIDAASFADCYRGRMKVQEFPRGQQREGAPAPAPAPAEPAPAL